LASNCASGHNGFGKLYALLGGLVDLEIFPYGVLILFLTEKINVWFSGNSFMQKFFLN
jgi:hypothetical protein